MVWLNNFYRVPTMKLPQLADEQARINYAYQKGQTDAIREIQDCWDEQIRLMEAMHGT